MQSIASIKTKCRNKYRLYKIRKELRPYERNGLKYVKLTQAVVYFDLAIALLNAVQGFIFGTVMMLLAAYLSSRQIRTARLGEIEREKTREKEPLLRVIDYENSIKRELFDWLFYNKPPRSMAEFLSEVVDLDPNGVRHLALSNQEIKYTYELYLLYKDEPFFNKKGIIFIELNYPDIVQATAYDEIEGSFKKVHTYIK